METLKPRILVVEDDPASRELLVRRLQSRGFEIASCNDGAECLLEVERSRPDLILLDVNMPNLSGLEVVQRLRAVHSHDALPVILVTALGETTDVVAGLQAGANDYVVKPVQMPVLLARIGVCMKIKHGVALLMEAERDRAMLETLARACEQVAQPMTAMTLLLESLVRAPPSDPQQMTDELRHILEVMSEAGNILRRLRALAGAGTVPYTERLDMIQSGTTHSDL